MLRRKRPIALSFLVAALLVSSAALAKKPRDDFFNPQEPGTHLKLFAFFGPGFRATLENRMPIEPEMSEVQTQLMGDVNPGFSEGSFNVDVRVFLLVFGASVGLRDDWHILKFEPDKNGLDHGERELNRESRWLKEFDQDWQTKTWPWYEGRVRVLMPMYDFMGVSTFSLRYQDRGKGLEGPAYDWPLSTVMDDGLIGIWESFLVAHGPRWGFAGPAARVLYVPRNGKYNVDLHYGLLAGTQAGPGRHDLILLRLYTTFGLDDDFMGTHAFRAPIQVVLGYQADFEL